MKLTAKWGILIGAVLITAGAVFFAGWRIWQKTIRTQGRPLDAAQREELKRKLDDNPKSIFIYDPITSYRLKPNFRGLRHDSEALPHVTNSSGILGEEEVNPDPGVTGILFLGDSVAYGEHVSHPETFISRMGEMSGPGFQLLNAGCPGWSTHQELLAYRNYFSRLPIDAVAIVFALNDLLRFEWVWRDGESFRMSAELRGLGGLAHSRFTSSALKKIRERFWERPELKPLAGLNNTCLNAYLPESWEEFFRRNGPALKKIASEKILLFISVPARPQLEALNAGGDADVVLFPQRQLEEFCRKNRIVYIDSLEAFEKEGGGYDTSLFFGGGIGLLHLSPRGHEAAADFLWPRIESSVIRNQ